GSTLTPTGTPVLTTTLSGGIGPNGTITTDNNIIFCATNNPGVPANCVYDTWIVKLPGWGPISMSMLTYNYSTHVATFQVNCACS
ncbi:hypothetical protein Q8G48_28690, partial [Klebsiella pneumoniae]|uniref:hypothetical protein n=1 Tax=Klebsiella pneumoniae TaxID=573 RepID=UPI0030137380